MPIKHIMKYILRWLKRNNNNEPDSSKMIENLLNKLIISEEGEISCDDVYKVLAEFTEMQQRGEDVAHLMPLVQKHLDMCPDCKEEHEALIQAINSENQILDEID